MKIDDLEPHERLVFGALIRMMVRSDGSFSEPEEATIDRIGEQLGGAGRFWSEIVSTSAQAFPDEASARAAVGEVTRLDARKLILQSLRAIADSDGEGRGEGALIAEVAERWGM